MTEGKFTVLVDIDGVLLDTLPAWLDWLNNKYNTQVLPTHIKLWDVADFFPELSPEQVREPLYTPAFWDTVKPKQGAVEGWRALKRRKDLDVFICTSSGLDGLKDKFYRAVFPYFENLSWNDVIIASRKQMVLGDFLIDDGLHNALGGNYTTILIDAPYNKSYNNLDAKMEKRSIVRVTGWDEVMPVLQQLIKQKKSYNNRASGGVHEQADYI